MARLVLALGTSHSPLLALDSPEWEARAKNDRTNNDLIDTDGRHCTYGELASQVGERYATLAVASRWKEQENVLNAALDRLARDLDEARPDVVVVVGDDEHELFESSNMPALAIYYGEELITRHRLRADSPRAHDPAYAWMKKVARMYGMDDNHSFPAAPAFARELIEGLTEAGFDVGGVASVPEPARAGFGHAYGFVIMRLFGGRRIPVVPILLNTYYPPNQPTPTRCHQIGLALRAAIEASPQELRVAVIASGGLSHFVTNEPLDLEVLDALRVRDGARLRDLPTNLLNSGSSEIRNWITLGGMLDELKYAWSEYVPVYRTPAGTGIGLAFGRWS